ncbi:hypothetical protein WJX81_000248 [Elliptochloris bilobata]|uniref:DNA topoisomerase (ATP-hydrolyzing) n=1 Tax=Elliptochloris bilobata TaxID=381761 RepID=A0AAW1RUC8_9CHLO
MAHLPSLRAAAAGLPYGHSPLLGGMDLRSTSRGFAFQHTAAARQPAAPPGAVAGGVELAGGGDGGNGGALRVIDTELRVETEQSYLAYAMSVIVGRALPDVRDGLKPVHRRILYAMHELGLLPTRPFRKCARVVGEVLGKYHPHGDSAVYDALVRLAQNFSMRAPLVSGHGNFGSLDADPPAAMRYTECRLQAFASAVLLADLEYDTVDMAPTFDGSQEEPLVLPARVPQLLVNGTSGIAVGIATRIPPHNLREVVTGLRALIADPDISIAALMALIPAPDFPTGGEIVATSGIAAAYETGRGGITVRGRAFIEEEQAGSGRRGARKVANGRPVIVITELPYQTNKAAFVADVARLVDEQKLIGISDVRDESDRDGMRVVVEVKRGSSASVVLNSLYKQTALQGRFPCNMVALVGGTPQTLTLKQFLQHFLDFRCEVIGRRARFDMAKAQRRQHLVEGLLHALSRLDAIVAAIRAAQDGPAAAAALRTDFGLSAEQAEAVLGMALRRLTSLEAGKLEAEAVVLAERITELQDLLARPERILATVDAEATELAEKFGDARRTSVCREAGEGLLTVEDVTPNTASLLVFSRRGYLKRMRADLFSPQLRGGRGVAGARLREGDGVDEVAPVMDHDTVLFFQPDGLCRSLKAHQIPEGSRTSAGTAIAQVLPGATKDTRVAAVLPLSGGTAGRYVVMLTRGGQMKKTPMAEFADSRAPKRNGKAAINVADGDELVWVGACTAADSVLLAASDGMVTRFRTDDTQLRARSRTAGGVTAMRLRPGVSLVGMTILPSHVPFSSTDSLDDEPDEDEDAELEPAEALALNPESTSDHAVSGNGVAGAVGADGAGEPAGDPVQGSEIRDQGEEAGGPWVLLVTRAGIGKRVPVRSFPVQNRPGKGRIGIKLYPDDALAAVHVVGLLEEGAGVEEELLLGSAGGLMTRTALANVHVQRRHTKGVRLMRLAPGDSVQIAAPLRAAAL